MLQHLRLYLRITYFKYCNACIYHGMIITSTKEVMFSPGFVCASVCLFVNKITQKLMDGF